MLASDEDIRTLELLAVELELSRAVSIVAPRAMPMARIVVELHAVAAPLREVAPRHAALPGLVSVSLLAPQASIMRNLEA